MKKTGIPFHRSLVELEACSLSALEKPAAEELAGILAAMDPWRRLGYSKPGLLSSFTRPDPALARYRIIAGFETAGVVSIRHPWLRGPFLELICVLEGFQGKGLGRTVLGWMAAEAKGLCPNLWTTVSSFNQNALAFYRRSGFVKVGILKGLVKEGCDEILLRKPIEIAPPPV